MRFSLIVATLGRVEELRRLFVSLSEQTYRDFEIILVDQNTDDRLLPLVSDYSRCFCLEHIHSAKGLSKARNVGMKYVRGDVIAFPDDDCWYDSDLLQRLAAMFPVNSGWAGITGRAVDQNGDPTSGRWDRRTGVITPGNVWRRAISFSIFLRTSVAVMHHFDETLGVGAETPWGAGEETDFLLRVIEAGNQVHYDPAVTVRHPELSSERYSSAARNKARSYGMGMGRVLRKHKYPLYAVAYHLIRPLGGWLLASASGQPGKARHHLSVLSGRAEGWVSRHSDDCFQIELVERGSKT